MNKQQKSTSFLNKGWVSSIGVFILSQLIFITFEATGWYPRFREIDNSLIINIMESKVFTEWLNFYELPQLNLSTALFVIICLIPGIIAGIRETISKSK